MKEYTVAEIKDILGKHDDAEALLSSFQKYDNGMRADIEKAKTKKGVAVTEKSEIETVLTGLLDNLQAKTPDEATSKMKDFETKLEKALEGMGDLTTKFNQSESDKKVAEKEKELALRDSGFVGALSDKGIKDPSGILLAAMKQLAEKDSDSGHWNVGKQTASEFLQGQIDSKEPMFKQKDKIEAPPKSGDVYSFDELEKLAPKEIQANQDKVDRSMKALS